MKLRVIKGRRIDGVSYKPLGHNPDGTWNSGIYEDVPEGHAKCLLAAGAAEQIDKDNAPKKVMLKKSSKTRKGDDN